VSGFVQALVARSAGLAPAAPPPRPAVRFPPPVEAVPEPALDTLQAGLPVAAQVLDRPEPPVRVADPITAVTVAPPPPEVAREAVPAKPPTPDVHREEPAPSPEPVVVRPPAPAHPPTQSATVPEPPPSAAPPEAATPRPPAPAAAAQPPLETSRAAMLKAEIPAPEPSRPRTASPSTPPPAVPDVPTPPHLHHPTVAARLQPLLELPPVVAVTPPPRPEPEARPVETPSPAAMLDRPLPVPRPSFRQPPLLREPAAEPAIEVHIGRVEVRPARPPAPDPQDRPAPRLESGFDEFALARRGLDRRWY
jgi:hypothetical protein